METNENLFELQIDTVSGSYLGEAARWAKFLSIVGFVVCGFLVLAGLFASTLMSTAIRNTSAAGAAIGSTMLMIMYIAFGLLYFMPCLYMFRFASGMQLALRANEPAALQQSFKNLKSCFRFIGILTIILLAIYGIVLIVGVGAALVSL